jgi:hypothetical protein
MAVDPDAIVNEVIARMDAEDAKTVLGKLVQYLDEQKLVNAQRAESQRLLAINPKATLSQREQATKRHVAHGVAAVTHDIGLQHAVLLARTANAKRDRLAVGEQPAERNP